MSELSELIKINRNIEKQNGEIIRLLKKIAGESDFNEVVIEEDDHVGNLILDVSPGVGEVYFIDHDIFRLSIKNNEITIDNLSGNSECSDYNIAEIIANESIKNNKCLDDSTVILTDSSKSKLPETLRQCIENGAKKAYIPWNQMAELIRAPQDLQILLKLDFYKTNEDLIEKLFNIK